eukprot:c15096_g1_i1.p1 GENE.c15096_g1_i1~~c15096_g1_i1.p1  ORF type:complete len:254 (-),score=48.45 c15096_g1_i1:191-952(-)
MGVIREPIRMTTEAYVAALSSELQALQSSGLLLALPNTLRLLQTEIGMMSQIQVIPITQPVTTSYASLAAPGAVQAETLVHDNRLIRKIFVPTHLDPSYNFVGRLLGPKGLTMKAIESVSNAKVLVRGKGSVREDKKQIVRCKYGDECTRKSSCAFLHPNQSEDDLRGQDSRLNLHLKEPLHVVIMAANTPEGHECVRAAEARVLALMIPDYTSGISVPTEIVGPVPQIAWTPMPMYGATTQTQTQDERYQPY